MARRWKIKFSQIFSWICIAERGAPFSISAAELRDLMGGDMQDDPRTEKSSLCALVFGAQKQHILSSPLQHCDRMCKLGICCVSIRMALQHVGNNAKSYYSSSSPRSHNMIRSRRVFKINMSLMVTLMVMGEGGNRSEREREREKERERERGRGRERERSR